MRRLLVVAAVAALGLTACGSQKAAAPLTIDERVPTTQDAPGWKLDPVERPVSVSGPDEFISKLGERFINPSQKDISDFKAAGFVRALHETKFLPATPNGRHTKTAPHLFSLVLQFDSKDGAKTGLDLMHADSLRPCPQKCSTQIKEFDVDISNAKGVRRFATAADIRATGDEGPPYDSYEIQFADGVFAYRITLSGRPGKVSQDEAEKIVKALYDRVKGAPAKA